MPTASPAFHFTGLGSLEKASFSPGATFHATLDDLANVQGVTWSIASTDETGTVPTLTTSGPKGSSVSGVVGAAGTAGLLQATVNAGIDPLTEQPSAAMTATAKWFVPTTIAGFEVGCVGEEMQSHSKFGSTGVVNAPIRALDAVSTAALAATLNAIISNDSGTAALAAGSGVLPLNIGPGLVQCTFTTPFDDNFYTAHVTAEDLGGAAGAPCTAWIVARDPAWVKIGTTITSAGVTAQVDGVGFNLTVKASS